ncbi:ral guanine nucleotide dissociation stimulator-like isoform X1 [Diceros bicornis minor]|uniref:ral guanine nucleotide dissociation stimulator-like isoform X1 n=1 Tax=Diceros bicornis minor TaxID=77932 RepID=UPI0026ECFE2F|nr:ral guanine nucleotide dissociation stimulator-like isoform X1 [Diceros bicornis minor]
MAFPPKLVVEQFTMMDAELFQKVVSSPCLGSTWGKRNKPGNEHQTPNVQATVDHEFEILKNFFSSCTVNSALQKTFTSHLKNTRGKFPGSQDPAAPSIFTTSPRGCILPAPGMCVAEDSHGPGGKTGCSSSDEETGSRRPGHKPKLTPRVRVGAGLVLESQDLGGWNDIGTS